MWQTPVSTVSQPEHLAVEPARPIEITDRDRHEIDAFDAEHPV